MGFIFEVLVLDSPARRQSESSVPCVGNFPSLLSVSISNPAPCSLGAGSTGARYLFEEMLKNDEGASHPICTLPRHVLSSMTLPEDEAVSTCAPARRQLGRSTECGMEVHRPCPSWASPIRMEHGRGSNGGLLAVCVTQKSQTVAHQPAICSTECLRACFQQQEDCCCCC